MVVFVCMEFLSIIATATPFNLELSYFIIPFLTWISKNSNFHNLLTIVFCRVIIVFLLFLNIYLWIWISIMEKQKELEIYIETSREVVGPGLAKTLWSRLPPGLLDGSDGPLCLYHNNKDKKHRRHVWSGFSYACLSSRLPPRLSIATTVLKVINIILYVVI